MADASEMEQEGNESMEIGDSLQVGRWASSQEVVRITSTMEELRTKIRPDLVRGVTLDAWRRLMADG